MALKSCTDRRFDRIAVPGEQPTRIHMATAAGLVEAYPEYNQHLGDIAIVRLTRGVTADARDVEEVMRRAVFNVIAHNRDDHARNIAYLCTPGSGWRLAPAYDLTYSMGPRPTWIGAGPGEHYLDVMGRRRDITRQHLMSLAKACGLKPSAVDEMIDATLAAVAHWPDLAAANGVSDEVIDQIARRLPALADG